MSARLFDVDELTGLEQRFHWNDDGTFSLETIQDVTLAVEACRARRVKIGDRARWNELGEHVGYIPEPDLERMMIDGSIRDPKAIERFLIERPELKTRPWERLT